MPLFRGLLAGEQGMILRIHDVLLADSRPPQQGSRGIVAIAVPRRAHAPCPQSAHRSLLIGAEPIRRLAAAHTQYLADTRLAAQQGFAPRPGREDVDIATET